jgi:hypothetical protein
MTNDQLFLTIRRLFTADDAAKSKLDTESLLLLIRQLVQRADEQSTFLSQSTLANQLLCSESTIADRTEVLKSLGIFAVKSGKRSNSPNEVTVMLNKLPQGDLKPTTVSDVANQMAANYKAGLLKINPKRRFQLGTVQRWGYVMQWLLDKKCKGDFALLTNVFNFAFNHPDHAKAAERGPDRIKKRWNSLFTEYSAAHSTEAAK